MTPADFTASHQGQRGPIYQPMTRQDLADLFALCRLKRGAEIGVERGLFSEEICKAAAAINHPLHLLCVDAWTPYAGYREHVTAEKLDGFYAETLDRLRPYNASIVRKFSVDAAQEVPDGWLDFVYIDGNHQREQVLADLAAWTQKVRPGGIVSGHDYGRSSVGQVKEAVTEWTEAHGIAPWFVLTGDRSPSWFWVQP